MKGLTYAMMFANARRSGFALLTLSLAGTLLVAGCTKAPQSETPAQGDQTATPAVTTPVAAEPAVDSSALLKQIEGCADMLAWHAVQSEYLAGTGRDAAVDTALAAKEQELLAKTPGWSVNDALQIVAFNWDLDGEVSSEGKAENFTATWLFKAKQDVQLAPGIEVKQVLRGWPDASHRHYLKEAGRKEERYFEFTYDFTPALGEWKAGNYYRIERKIKSKLPNVPYRIHTVYSQVKKNEDGTTSFAGPYAELTDLGWFADLGN